jgi:hypothetical protein
MAEASDGGFRTVTRIVVVKRCLLQALNNDLMPYQRERFLKLIDQYTEMASKMARRASLAFIHYVTRTLEDGKPPPELPNNQNAYWRRWLRIGLEEFGDEMPSPDARPYFDEIRHLLGTTLGCGPVPEFFNGNVLGSMAIQFATAVFNTHEVHFIAKLKRMCKYAGRQHEGLSGYKVLCALRSNKVPPDWPVDVKDFIAEARSRLELADSQILYDDTEIDFATRFGFNWWMQQRFAELGERKIMMAPAFSVARMHVRLSATTLYQMARACLKPEEPERVACPRKKDHPNDYVEARRVYDEYKQRRDNFKADLAHWKEAYPSLTEQCNNSPGDPIEELNEQLPVPKIGRRPKDMPVEEWNEIRDERRRVRDDVLHRRAEVVASEAHKARVKAYTAYEQGIHAIAMKLFKPFKDKSLKMGWVPAASVMTDGVSLSIGYEKEVLVRVDEKKKRRKPKAADEPELKPCDDYDPEEPTVVGDLLVLGVDPGRTCIVTIVCVDKDGKRHKWHLSRGRYYTEAGILTENRRQGARYAVLKPHFARITDAGGALKASNSGELIAYLKVYATFQQEWWGVALRRAETRAKMSRYIGKRRTMDRFFEEVLKDARKLSKNIEIAYGSAGLTMPSSGRGEVAVPTTEAFRAVKRHCERVSVVSEINTSKTEWATKRAYEKVYKRTVDGKEHLFHTPNKRAPFAAPEDVEAVKRDRELLKEKAKRRRGGTTGVPERANEWAEREEGVRYIDVRGLQFSTETRMFFGRDASSARAIAGLRCLELKGLGRPTCFRLPPRAQINHGQSGNTEVFSADAAS